MGKRVILFLLVLTLFSSLSFAYPVIISNEGVNHTRAKELVYSIPEKYYRYVDTIEFVSEPIRKFYWENDNEAEIIKYGGWYHTYWNKDHICYNGKILIYNINYNILKHEIGHAYEYCDLKKDISTEDFANEFVIK